MKKLKLRLKQLSIIIEYCLVFVVCKIMRIDHRDIWLIAERGDEARDNGFAFFEYMRKEHSEIKARYVISKKSIDREKIKNKEDIVYLDSLKHFIYFITAGKLISTHIMGYSPEFRMFNKLDKWNLVKIKGKRIFLQHGVTKDYSEGLHKGNIKLDLFICGARPEHEFLLKTTGFDKDVLKYTGFARYDNLVNVEDNFILVMPTWRMDLFYCPNINEFKKTEYYIKWNELIQDEELLKFLKSVNMKLIFYPHYEIQPFLKAFNFKDDNIIIANSSKYDVQDLLNKCKMLITDYSSVYFDVAYLKKPVVYFQFDYKEYRSKHYKEGWFSYERDAFGPIGNNVKNTVKLINRYVNNKYAIEAQYVDNRNKTFLYQDKNNSKRIYDEIIKLESEN